MKRLGTISYNIYCNFTNYGSALQTWALHQAIKKIGKGHYQPILVDYCPDILANKSPLNPFENMWDQDEESQRMCKLSLPAIRENYVKFHRFYNECFDRTQIKYTSQNFDHIIRKEHLDGFICGSDTIFCPDEFGFDDGYYANYECMKQHSVAYAASFGDPHFIEGSYQTLNERLKNFKAFGLRENLMLSYVSDHTDVLVQKVLDPTLLLTSEDYDKITAEKQEKEKYLLLYARRYNPVMEAYAEKIAAQNGWKIIEISLRATNAEKQNHRMFYEAGVEEFLSLVKYAEFIVTNSFHGIIFSVQYKRPFVTFSREQCNTKIVELLELFGITEHMLIGGTDRCGTHIDFDMVHARIDKEREISQKFLEIELKMF